MSRVLDKKFDAVPAEYLIVCEGYGDVCFLDVLTAYVEVDNVSIGCPRDTGMGSSAIASYLKAVQGTIQKGSSKLRGILVVADADDNAERSFESLRKSLADAQFSAPAQPFSIEGEPVSTAVFMIPGKGQTGTLEHLLWKAAIESRPVLEKCVDTFLSCVGDHQKHASENKQAKMKMSSLVAAFCYDNPWSSPALLWKQKNNPVPINSPLFKELTDFLKAFVS